MKRVGIAASKMARGNLFLYNLYVVMISSLICLMLFLIAGSSIALALIVIGYLVNGVLPEGLTQNWFDVMQVCMIALTVVISIVDLMVIARNLKLTK